MGIAQLCSIISQNKIISESYNKCLAVPVMVPWNSAEGEVDDILDEYIMNL